MMRKLIYFVFLILLAGCSNLSQKDVLTLVNPFIGTDGHGHTYPGAAFPFGMVQLSPDTRKDNWDACSGYHYSDTAILGFSHAHLSGTGVGDYGDIRFTPMTGALRIRPGDGNNPGAGYRSRFSHEKETASPGYYQVFLEDHQVNAEFTVTQRCGLHQYTFPSSRESFILIDLTESVVTEKNPGLSVRIVNDHEISGFRRSSGWAADQVIYFYAVFSRPFDEFGTALDGRILPDTSFAEGNDVQAYVKFVTSENEKVMVKVGISGVSIDGARKNLESEIPGWDFDQVKQQAESAWSRELGRIEVKGGHPDDFVKFYTALYHCYLAPNLFSDVDGLYRGHDGAIHNAADHDVYTVFSLWDTYRALHPLMTLIQPERTVDFIKTFLDIYEKGGLLPVWELAGNETNCMIGYHAVPVIFDAYIKGITGYDVEKAYTAMKNSAMQDQFGLKWYREYGYIPAESEGEAVSKTLEYAYDDWCIAMMAKKLGKVDDYRYFIERAQYYKNIFDPDTRFLRGKRNGMFTAPFDPAEVNFMLTEANTWQYTFYVPQDISGLSALMGGDQMFEEKLDEMFSASAGLSGRQQADITGLIGQYAHGNEPSHHMAYLYNYVGRPAKTQKIARQIMDELYGSGPAGLCGNEDCGQMSAWFVMSAMGFYPVTPGLDYYVLGSPLFEEIKINFENGNNFVLQCENNSSTNIYIQSAKLNGTVYEKSYLNHEDLVNGGSLVLVAGSDDNGKWGTLPENRPFAAISDQLITPVPFYQAASNSFQDSLEIIIRHIDDDQRIYYQIEDEKHGLDYDLYQDPLSTGKAITLNAYATKDLNSTSKLAKASFYKIHHDWQITIKNPYSAQYTGGGDMGLIDGQRGGPNFRTGSWQGYQGVDFEVIIDMGAIKNVSKIGVSFLQDQRSWIFMPEEVEFYISQNTKDYLAVGTLKNDVSDSLQEAVIKDFFIESIKGKGRYVKIRAVNRGVCPEWHVGAGEKAWIFVDEITIE
jgi:predicted alpha-1,2-mannosidase